MRRLAGDDKVWIAAAPPGVPSSGPAVIWNTPGHEATLAAYEQMGWNVLGPYLLEADLPMEARALLP